VNRITLGKIEGVSVLDVVGMRTATIPGRVPAKPGHKMLNTTALSLE
jgi:hypothetical protein